MRGCVFYGNFLVVLDLLIAISSMVFINSKEIFLIFLFVIFLEKNPLKLLLRSCIRKVHMVLRGGQPKVHVGPQGGRGGQKSPKIGPRGL